MKNPAVSGGVQQKCMTFNSGVLDFDLHFNACREVNALETVNGCLLRIDNVDEPLVDTHFKVLSRVFVNVWSTDHGITMLVRRQWNRPTNGGIGTSDSLDDFARRLINDLVIKCFETNTNDLSHDVQRLT